MTQPQYPHGQYQQPQQQFPGYPQPGPYGQPPSGYAPVPKPPRPPLTPQQKALAVVGGSLGIFLIALLVLGLTTTNSSTERTTTANDQIVDSPRSSGSNKDEDIKAIKQTISGMADAAKANDFKKMLTFFCAKYREAFKDIAGSGQAPDLNALTKADNGPSKITGLEIDGDVAVIHITDAKGKHDIEFKKETGGWKFCPGA
ncbi:hypothetical protein MSTE_00357 [Mycobacteroides stephanolepidis]|uniref:DUF4878 domain-containing protein n=1 Tax=[Mycobacterium] stephanolepidis TaxID=1520670 RepID=A0A1Z4ERX6_9MYCO|nr:hypothetical protein [[Mycobacterium] stephanolepidis]BAX95701.1 hypothetical protein MSTE_00357 [[Mycobacterium] stephanolepidis]